MVKAMLVKFVLKKVMEAISKTPDEEIAANHEARLVRLEKNNHEPIFTKKQHSNILKRLKNLEDKCSKCTK
tara:strand:+ start:1859 stop:2071 length:213 start_codon:yes stop_codon:yes gene_type:complete